jgi:SPP1 family holin
MKKINLKGITSEAVTGVLVLIIALVNAVLQMFGINTLPVENEEISAIISGVFVVGAALYNTWKNRNVTPASQIAQQVTDMIKNGELLAEDVQELISKVKK